MFERFGKTLIGVATLTLLVPGAHAAVDEAARRCAEIARDADRLACYDRLFAPATHHDVAQSAAPTSNAAPPMEATPTSAAASTATAAVASDQLRRDFGLSAADKNARTRQEERPADLDSISVTIQSVSRRSTGEQVFRTSDGQVWVEVESGSRVRVEPGDSVTIRKAALGSFVLVTSSKAGTKVRRVD